MSAKTGQSVAVLFTTNNPAIGSAVDADATPVGKLYLNGTANAATVTVTNIDTGRYKAAVTMPTLVAGDRVSLSVTATVGGVTGKGIIWGDMGETATASDVHARLGPPAGASVAADIATRAATGAAMTLTSGERTSIAGAVSGLATTGLAALKALLDAVKLKSDTIGTGQAIVISPITPSGTITLYSGDDYASADSRAITVTVADTGHVLGLDGAVVKLKATQATWDAASVVSTTDGYTVTFEATAAQTAAVTRAQHYELEATLANGHVVTLAKGSLLTRTNIPAVV